MKVQVGRISVQGWRRRGRSEISEPTESCGCTSTLCAYCVHVIVYVLNRNSELVIRGLAISIVVLSVSGGLLI